MTHGRTLGILPRAAGEGVRTTCPYCGVGCGVIARPIASASASLAVSTAVSSDGKSNDGLAAGVELGASPTVSSSSGKAHALHAGKDQAEGDPEFEIAGDPGHPANFGRLCSKGSALGETLGLDGRLLHPQIRGRRASWGETLDYVAQGFKRIVEEHGPDAVALYVSGQLLTEDYYVANKLMKGFIGTANIDTNSRLCMSSAVAGHKRAFGEDLVPVCYDDLPIADLIVLAGSNTAWCHPVLFQRITDAKQRRPELKVVVVDPRRTATCEFADLHLPVRAGTDVWLFNGLLSFLHQHGAVDTRFVAEHTSGVDQAVLAADDTAGDLRTVARTCGIDEGRLADFYALFARTDKTITIFSQGVNQSSAGTDKVNSIINCHLLTGRIGRPGMGPFSVTGQPNAMGGREVGGLANMLAAHMDLENPEHGRIVQQFWNSPVIAARPGLKAVDLFDAIHDGKVKAVWIMATNPVVSLPDADKVKAALQRCELVVVSDCVQDTDTNALAHVLLPAAAWGEKDGTVTNSDRHISRQRAFMSLPGEAKPDWWIISQVARRMGYGQAFDFASAHDIFVQHAALSGAENHGQRAFDISGLAALSRSEYAQMLPVQWPVPATGHVGTARLLGDGRFYHPDSKARFVPTIPRLPANRPDEQFPLVLNTGRVRDQWHTMTRSGKAPRLTSHAPEPYVDMHAQDALLAGAREGELVRVTTKWGSMIARLRISGEMPRGMIFVPIHWSGAFSSDARAGTLVNPVVDPISGEPEFKHTPACVTPFVVSWHGFILSREPLPNLDMTWWTRVQGAKFLRYEIVGRRAHGDWSHWAQQQLNATHDDADWLEYCDTSAGIYRGALLEDDSLAACIFVSPRPDLPSRSWLSSLFAKRRLADEDRAGLLIGQAPDPRSDTGPIVCSCFGVGRRAICEAITQHKLTSAQEVGRKLRAGTNCGSCVPEIRMLLSDRRWEAQA